VAFKETLSFGESALTDKTDKKNIIKMNAAKNLL
jgi:hypothetical protein